MWWASGILSFMGALAVAALVPREAVRAAAAGGDAAPVSNPRLRRMTFAYGLFGFGYVITATFLVAIVRDTPAARDLERAVWIVAGLAAAPSVAFWSSLGRRFGLPTAFAAAALTEACGVLASVIWPGAVGLCLAAVLVGGTFMGLTALGLMRGRELALGHDPRRVMAAMTAAFGVGQIAGPVVAGTMSDALGGFMAPSVMAAAALVLAAWLARR